MVRDVAIRNKQQHIDVAPIFEVYEMVCGFQDHVVPTLTNLFNQYNSILEGRIASLHASIYSDDFYDGSPGSVPVRMFPDSIKNSLSERIGMNDDLSMEELQEVLENFCIFYADRGQIRHKAQVEVW